MNDSTNVRVMADNIRELKRKIESAGSGLPDVTSEDAGKVLTVSIDGEWGADNLPESGFPYYTLKTVSTSGSLATIAFTKILNGKAVYYKLVKHNDSETYIENMDGFSLTYNNGWVFAYPNIVRDGELITSSSDSWSYTETRDFVCYPNFATENTSKKSKKKG